MPAPADGRSSVAAIDREAGTMRFERDLYGTPEQVFTAWTRPEHVSKWWDATGKPLSNCAIDLRVGGRFSFAVQDHPEAAFAGVYREIVPGRRLVFDALGAVGTVELSRTKTGTRMVVEITCASPEHMEQFVRMGVDRGTSATMDNLVRYLGEEAIPTGQPALAQ